MARDFNGSSDYLILTSAIVTGVPCTFAGWFFLDSSAADSFIIGHGMAANNSMINVYVRSVLTLRANVQNNAATGSSATTTATTSAGVWAHICGVFSANNSRAIFLNGANKATNSTSIAVGSVDRSLIGAAMENGVVVGHANGKIAEVGIWNVALTDAEVASLGAGFCPRLVRPQSLQSYVPLVGQYSPEIDLRGRTWTVTGSPSQSPHPRIFY